LLWEALADLPPGEYAAAAALLDSTLPAATLPPLLRRAPMREVCSSPRVFVSLFVCVCVCVMTFAPGHGERTAAITVSAPHPKTVTTFYLPPPTFESVWDRPMRCYDLSESSCDCTASSCVYSASRPARSI
jgi:hypothetical protein